MISLVHVNPNSPEHINFLLRLLAEREDGVSISHVSMPTFDQHKEFVARHPYRAWYLINKSNPSFANQSQPYVGACYLTRNNEIGIAIANGHRRHGYAGEALRNLIAQHQPLTALPSERAGRFIAHINPANVASIRLFNGLGMAHISNTYALPERGNHG